MTVTFCGHKNISDTCMVKKQIYIQAEILIKQGANKFLLGGYGIFDNLAASVIKELKIVYPYIESVIILPYIDRKYDENLYDNSEYPALEKVPKKYAILKRNEYMIDSADVVIAYVKNNFGGAYKSLEYAQKKKKKIIKI